MMEQDWRFLHGELNLLQGLLQRATTDVELSGDLLARD
jgi:hypothetical protein